MPFCCLLATEMDPNNHSDSESEPIEDVPKSEMGDFCIELPQENEKKEDKLTETDNENQKDKAGNSDDYTENKTDEDDMSETDNLLFLTLDADLFEDLVGAAASCITTDLDLQKIEEELKKSDMENMPPVEIPSIKLEEKSGEPQRKRFKTCNEKDMEALFEARQAPSTKRNTMWAMGIVQDWSKETYGTETDMKTVKVPILAEKLKKFYAEARPAKTPDQVYHRNTLINIRGGVNRFLADLKRNIDIVKDTQFKVANGVLDGLLKERVRLGISKPTQHKPIIDESDLQKISTYLCNAHTHPIILRQHVWYNITIHFVSRGMEFHHQLRTDSLQFNNDDSGEYVTLSHDVLHKNFQGGLRDPENNEHGKRMYATGSDACPVKMLKLFIEKTDPTATSLFNQYNKHAVENKSLPIWYTAKSLAKRTFSNILPEILYIQSRIITCMDSYTYQLRSASENKLVLPKPHSENFRKSFTYSGVVIWNSLPIQVKHAGSLLSFKQGLKLYLQSLQKLD